MLGWIALLVAVSVLVVQHPIRSIFDVYRDGVHHWWAAQPLYGSGMRSFVYLTSSPLIFSPAVLLGPPWDDLAWRLFSVALFLFGAWRLIRLVTPREQATTAMALLLLLLLPCAGVNVQRGQAELAMAGWMFLGAAALAEGRWWRAALWLCLAVAVKPLALVLVLLYCALVAPMRGRLALGMAVVLLLPFARPDWTYVVSQEQAMVRHLLWASHPVVWRFNEVGNMLRRAGVDLPPSVLTAIRVLGAAVTLFLAGLAWRRKPRESSAVLILALAVTYLMAFNPRTELGSYVDMAALAGVYMAEAWQRGRDPVASGGRRTAILLAALILALGTQVYGNWIFRPTDVWLKPLLALVFYGYLAVRAVEPMPASGREGRAYAQSLR